MICYQNSLLTFENFKLLHGTANLIQKVALQGIFHPFPPLSSLQNCPWAVCLPSTRLIEAAGGGGLIYRGKCLESEGWFLSHFWFLDQIRAWCNCLEVCFDSHAHISNIFSGSRLGLWPSTHVTNLSQGCTTLDTECFTKIPHSKLTVMFLNVSFLCAGIFSPLHDKHWTYINVQLPYAVRILTQLAQYCLPWLAAVRRP